VSSAELAVLVLVGTGTIAGLFLYILWPARPRRSPEEALNDSIVAQQWAGGLDHAASTSVHLPTHGGIDAPG
jgi:hypothetical protein